MQDIHLDARWLRLDSSTQLCYPLSVTLVSLQHACKCYLREVSMTRPGKAAVQSMWTAAPLHRSYSCQRHSPKHFFYFGCSVMSLLIWVCPLVGKASCSRMSRSRRTLLQNGSSGTVCWLKASNWAAISKILATAAMFLWTSDLDCCRSKLPHAPPPASCPPTPLCLGENSLVGSPGSMHLGGLIFGNN